VTNRFAAALSEHPVTAMAVGEVIGEVLERVGDAPDLALLFVTPPHAGAIDDAAAAVRATLRPATLLGCTAESVVGNAREVEGEPAVTLWAGRTGPVTPVRLDAGADDQAVLAPEGASGLVLLADPFTFPTEDVVAALDVPVTGGMASAARGPGGNRLVRDGAVHTTGAVGAFLGPTARFATVVSQGCRPIGEPFAVTKAERNLIYELGGKPALERLTELFQASGAGDRRLMNSGLHVGRVINEHKLDFQRGDFLVRNVLGGDKTTGAIAVGDLVDIGATVQFHVRDAETADEDLRSLLAGECATGALLFTCNGRGTRLFGVPDHDAEVVNEALDGAPLAGFFAAGELGPVGGRNFLHGFTASLALFE
jgi:small ligand-binding sensory domain FIST